MNRFWKIFFIFIIFTFSNIFLYNTYTNYSPLHGFLYLSKFDFLMFNFDTLNSTITNTSEIAKAQDLNFLATVSKSSVSHTEKFKNSERLRQFYTFDDPSNYSGPIGMMFFVFLNKRIMRLYLVYCL